MKDIIPALTLEVEKGDPSLMNRLPRNSKELILTCEHWPSILGDSSGIKAAWGILPWHVVNMRVREYQSIRSDVTENLWVWDALVHRFALLLRFSGFKSGNWGGFSVLFSNSGPSGTWKEEITADRELVSVGWDENTRPDLKPI